jgi:hypothetical protein
LSEETMTRFGELRRVSIVSFDFRQQGPSQARKTRFFRELYGYTQQVKQELKSGKVVTRTYHYAGLLDQTTHVKLGKSVFGLRPGSEGPVIRLMESFDEVVYFNFIGWLPTSLWPEKEEDQLAINGIIERFGSLAILIAVLKLGGNAQRIQLQEAGFDYDYATKAIAYLRAKGWLEEKGNILTLTRSGESMVDQLS